MKKLCALRDSIPGQYVQIYRIADPVIQSRALALGIGEGSVALCLCHLPKGPTVIRFGNQKIAFGFGLSLHVLVERMPQL